MIRGRSEGSHFLASHLQCTAVTKCQSTTRFASINLCFLLARALRVCKVTLASGSVLALGGAALFGDGLHAQPAAGEGGATCAVPLVRESAQLVPGGTWATMPIASATKTQEK